MAHPQSPPQPPSVAYLAVRSAPRIDDPRELQTILLTSLRALWGDLETHSHGVTVSKGSIPDGCDDDGGGGDYGGSRSVDGTSHLLFVKCPIGSVPAVRAALTMVTPPPYMEGAVYCLDVVSIREEGAR